MGTRLAKIGGILQETSSEELARQQDLPAAPTSPLGMAGIGASQDMAKMAGTGVQIRATIRETLKERTDVRDAMGEAERGATRGRFQVEQIQQQLQTLGGLGSLDNRVAEAVRARITAAEKPVTGLQNKIDDTALEATLKQSNPLLAGEELTVAVAAAKTALETLRSSPNAKNIVTVLTSLGIKATINDSASDLAQKLAETGVYDQATTEDIKEAMDQIALDTKDLKVEELTDLPFDKASAAAVLGITAADLDKMTLGEVKSQLAAYRSNTFTDVDELREVLDNPFSSQGQKDFARKRLTELGAVGVTSFEQKANNLQAQMEEGDTVKVGNKQIKVEDITTDPTLRATVAGALDDPKAMTDLEKSDPELAKWINTNKDALVPIKDELVKGLGNFAANLKSIKEYYGDAPPDALDKLVPGWRDATDTALEDLKKDQIANLGTIGQTLSGTLGKVTLDATQRNTALGLLARLGQTKAKQFSTDMLASLVTTACSEQEAVDFLNAYLTTSEDTRWKAEINTTVAFAFTPDEYYTQKVYDEEVAAIVSSSLPELSSLQEVVDKINQLAGSNSPADRLKAEELSKDLAKIKGQINSTINKTTIDKKREEIKLDRQLTDYLGVKKGLDDSLAGLVNELKNRPGGHLKDRGSEVVGNLKSKLATLSMQAQEGSISFEEAKKQADNLKTELAGELAAFLFDKNHREKHFDAAIEAVHYMLRYGLAASLSPNVRNGIRKIVSSIPIPVNEDGSPAGDTARKQQEIYDRI